MSALTLSKQKASAILNEVGRAFGMSKETFPNIVWAKFDRKYCPGFFYPRESARDKNTILICDDCGANQLVVLLHECSHWIDFEISGEVPAPHDSIFYQRTEKFYRIFNITPAEARETEKVGYPSSWKGIRTWPAEL